MRYIQCPDLAADMPDTVRCGTSIGDWTKRSWNIIFRLCFHVAHSGLLISDRMDGHEALQTSLKYVP
jgi:hypothetical protein